MFFYSCYSIILALVKDLNPRGGNGTFCLSQLENFPWDNPPLEKKKKEKKDQS